MLAYADVDPADVFIMDLKTHVSTRLTFENRSISGIVWSRDQKTLAFSRLSQAHGWQVYTKAADGTGPDSVLFNGPGMFNFVTDWSRDGRWIAAQCADSSGNREVWKVDMAGPRASVYQRTPEQEQGGAISPDGKWLAYTVAAGDRTSLYVQSFPNPGSKYQVSIRDPVGALWNARGDELLAASTDGTLYTIGVSTTGGFKQGATQRRGRLATTDQFLGLAPSGDRILVGRLKDVSSLSRIEVVLNWTHLLERGK